MPTAQQIFNMLYGGGVHWLKRAVWSGTGWRGFCSEMNRFPCMNKIQVFNLLHKVFVILTKPHLSLHMLIFFLVQVSSETSVVSTQILEHFHLNLLLIDQMSSPVVLQDDKNFILVFLKEILYQ